VAVWAPAGNPIEGKGSVLLTSSLIVKKREVRFPCFAYYGYSCTYRKKSQNISQFEMCLSLFTCPKHFMWVIFLFFDAENK